VWREKMAKQKSEKEIREVSAWIQANNDYDHEAYIALFNALEQIDDELRVSDVYKFMKLLDEQGFKVSKK
jgi:hypothetical protein